MAGSSWFEGLPSTKGASCTRPPEDINACSNVVQPGPSRAGVPNGPRILRATCCHTLPPSGSARGVEGVPEQELKLVLAGFRVALVCLLSRKAIALAFIFW